MSTDLTDDERLYYAIMHLYYQAMMWDWFTAEEWEAIAALQQQTQHKVYEAKWGTKIRYFPRMLSYIKGR